MCRTKSLGDLRAADPPDELLLWQGRAAAINNTQQQQQDKFDQQTIPNEGREEQQLGDPGYLVKIRKNKYLSKAARSHSTVCCCKPQGNCQRLQLIQRTRSESELQHKPVFHPKKLFVCEQIKEHFVQQTTLTSERQLSPAVANNSPTLCGITAHSNVTPQHIHHQQPPAVRPRRPPRFSTTKPHRQQAQASVQQNPAFVVRKTHQKKPTSFQSTTLFHSPAGHSLRQHIYVNTSQDNTSTDIPTVSLPGTRPGMTSPAEQPVHAHTSQIPPPPPPPPKSILKQNYEYKQEFVDGAQYWQDSAEFGHLNRGGHRSLLDNPEYQKQMAENLQALRPKMEGTQPQRQQTLQAVPFNGPFFRLEEVERVRSGPAELQVNLQRQQRYQEENMPPRSSPSVEQSSSHPDLSRTEELDDEGVVVIWPPLDYNNKKRPTSTPVTRNMRDPETLQEFQRQKQMEMEAIRQSEEREMRLREKQFQAAKVQQEQLLQRLKETGESVPNESMSLYQSCSSTGGQPAVRRYGQAPLSDPGQQNSPNLRVFEARPISAFSGDSGLPIDATFSTLGSASPSWKRTYIVDNTKQGEKLRNEILTSDEVLEKERFEIDLLKRREVFVEKVETPPEINRLGRRWQAPPEKPYVWPTLRRPVTIQTPSNEPEFTAQTNYHIVDHQEGYEWTPVVRDPGYKKERNNFTPTHSPPEPSRSGTLDEVAKRQIKNVIKPSPDGSHRPTPAFKHGRQTPSGGFYPHAPNSIKVIKKRNIHISNSHSPRSHHTVNQEGSDVQIIHKLDYRTTDLLSPHSTQNFSDLNEWEKIYDLPPHSSTLTDKAANAVPRIDIKRRMRAFQPTEREVPSPISRRSRSISGPVADLSQLNIKETAKTGSRLSPSAQKSLEHLRSGQSSPAPASYEKARRYVPPALPPGYRPHRANSQRTGERHVNQPAGHTKTLATTLQDVADSHHYNREPLAAHKLGSSVSPRRQQQTRPASSASVHFSNANGRPSPARCHSEFSSPGNQPNTATTRSQPISSEVRSYRTNSRTMDRNHRRHP